MSSLEKSGRHVSGPEKGDEAVLRRRFANWQVHNGERALLYGEVLDRIDFSAMQRIFEEDIRKSAPESAQINTLGRERILIVPSVGGRKVEMSYAPEANIISVNPDGIIKAFFENRDASKWTVATVRDMQSHAALFLFAIAHEMAEAHAFISYEHTVRKTWGIIPDTSRVRQQSGYEKSEIVRDALTGQTLSDEKTLEFWKEGVADWYAFHVAREYVRRNPFEWRGIHIGARDFDDQVPNILRKTPYAAAEWEVHTVLRDIATAAGLSEEIVGKALIRGFVTEAGRIDLIAVLQELYGKSKADLLINKRKRPISDPEAAKEADRATEILVKEYLEEHPEVVLRLKENATRTSA